MCTRRIQKQPFFQCRRNQCRSINAFVKIDSVHNAHAAHLFHMRHRSKLFPHIGTNLVDMLSEAIRKGVQRCLYGSVRLKFYKGSCTVVGRKSAYSLYDQSLATYDKGDTFNRSAAEGFIQIQTLSTRTWAVNRRKEGAPAELFDAQNQQGPLKRGRYEDVTPLWRQAEKPAANKETE